MCFFLSSSPSPSFPFSLFSFLSFSPFSPTISPSLSHHCPLCLPSISSFSDFLNIGNHCVLEPRQGLVHPQMGKVNLLLGLPFTKRAVGMNTSHSSAQGTQSMPSWLWDSGCLLLRRYPPSSASCSSFHTGNATNRFFLISQIRIISLTSEPYSQFSTAYFGAQWLTNCLNDKTRQRRTF